MRLLTLTTLLIACVGCGGTDENVKVGHADPCVDCEPIREGAEVRIAAGGLHMVWVENPDRLPPYTVATSDASIVAIESACGWSSPPEFCEDDSDRPDEIIVAAHAPGSARLTFHRQDGTLLEEVELSVVEVGSLEVMAPGGGVGFLGLEPPEWPRLLMRGGTDMFVVRMNDAAGERLLGFGAVQYTVPANAGVRDDRSEVGLYWVQPNEMVWVTAREVGPAPVEGRAGDAALALDIEVVDASIVAELRWERRGGWFNVGDDVQRVRAFTADGIEVHEPECDWTFDPLDHPDLSSGRNHVWRSTDEPINVRVTCTVGDISTSTSI